MPDMAAVTNALHVCDAVLGIDAWLEWVPSAANVADLPSRAASTWSVSARALMAKYTSALALRASVDGRCGCLLPISSTTPWR